jgi:hypothetical protein
VQKKKSLFNFIPLASQGMLADLYGGEAFMFFFSWALSAFSPHKNKRITFAVLRIYLRSLCFFNFTLPLFK